MIVIRAPCLFLSLRTHEPSGRLVATLMRLCHLRCTAPLTQLKMLQSASNQTRDDLTLPKTNYIMNAI